MSASPQPRSRYEIKERLPKQGAMGVVYRAWDHQTRRIVVLKTIGDVRNTTALDHFKKERDILSTINHANIVDVYDIGEMEFEGELKPFFVMPFLPGAALDQLIAGQRLTVERTVEMVTQVCRGLQAAHDRGVIHRDLKPSNIFVIDEVGTVKIIDFGVAHLSDHTGTGVKGTLLYMSPEQIQSHPLGPASDLFSLAVVCYEALTGQRPFQGSSQAEITHKIVHYTPPMVSDLNPAVSTLLSQVIHAAMAKRTQHRFASAREFGEALQRALHNRPIDRFDPKRAEPRIQKARRALETGQLDFAGSVLGELEAEGHLHPEMRPLRRQIDQAVRERNVRQLLDSARHFLVEEEYALARQKVQQALQSAPGHLEALEIQTEIDLKWTSQQVAEWLRLGREHLEGQSFTQAREAGQSALSLRPGDPDALQLIAETGRAEEQIARARSEAAEIFQSAREAYDRGEISAALSKAERVLEYDRQTPDKGAPDLAMMHQDFYNDVRGEHDAIRQAVVDVRRLVQEKDFQAAYEICDRYLARYPRDPQFRALKLEADHSERQHISAYIAEVERQVSAEGDLDRRVAILEKAAAAYPREDHFKRALTQAVEKRDLTASVGERARQLEERGQFAEALSQWETLRSIHPAYPGLERHIERLTARRDQQQRDEARQRRVNQIRRLIDGGRYEEAIRACDAALAEFPGSEDLRAAAEDAAERRKRALEIEHLMSEGHGFLTRGDFEQGIALLRQAFELDRHNDASRTVLVNALLSRAKNLQQTDPFRAGELAGQVLKIDPAHRGAAELQVTLAEIRKQAAIAGALERAEALQQEGNRQGARQVLQAALSTYPGDPLLTQSLRGLEEPAPAPVTPGGTSTFPAPVEPPRPVPYPPVWKIAAIVLGMVTVVSLLWLAVRPKAPVTVENPAPAFVKLEVRPVNPSARVYVDGEPVSGTTLELAPRDREYVIDARQPGYKSVPVSLKINADTRFSAPQDLQLEPYPTRLSLETVMRATYQGQDVTGPLELKPGSHTVEIANEGSILNLKIEADTGRHAKVTASGRDVSAFYIVTALGGEAELEMSPAAAQVTLDGQPLDGLKPKMNLPKLPPGEHVLTIAGRTLKFQSGEAPTITVQAIAPGNFGLLILNITDVGATVTLTGETATQPQIVKDRKVVFSGLRPGTYTIEIVKEGFEPEISQVAIQRGQNLPSKLYTLRPLKSAPALIITGGQPNTRVFLDDRLLGVVDARGQLRVENLPTGRQVFRLEHVSDRYERKTFPKNISLGQDVRLTPEELSLAPLRGIQVQIDPKDPPARLRFRPKGSAQWEEASGTTIYVPQPGVYELERLINGVRRGFKEVRVGDDVVATQVPLSPEPVKVAERQAQSLTLANFDPPQNNFRNGWYDVDASRLKGKVESGTLDFQVQFPRALIVVAKKAARWSLSTADGNCVEFEMNADKFGTGPCGARGKAMEPNKAPKSPAYKVRIRLIGSNVVTEIAPAGSPAYVPQNTRSLPALPVEFRFADGSIKDFRFSGFLAP